MLDELKVVIAKEKEVDKHMFNFHIARNAITYKEPEINK